MLKRIALKTVSKLVLQPWYRQRRGMTLGTRTAVIDGQSRILLVRHSYAPGWLLPGGGVERGETIFQSAAREIREEAAIVAEEEPALHAIYLNDAQFPGDHVACLVLRRFRQEEFKPSLEISEARFFATDALPEDATGATRRRIAEILGGRPIDRLW